MHRLPNVVPRETIAVELRNAVKHLLAARRELKKGSFSDDDETEWGLKRQTGHYASMQGLRTIAGALIALPDSEVAGLVRPELKSLLDEWASVMASSGKTGARDAFCGYEPYDSNVGAIAKTTARKTWTDSVSWALSTAVAWNYLFTHHESLIGKVSETLREQTLDMLAMSANELLALQLSDGGWCWGDASACRSSHLYFTWTAAQALADVYDYIFGDSAAQIGVERDNKTWAVLKQHELSETALREAGAKAAGFLDKTYLDVAIAENLTYDIFKTNGLSITKPEDDLHQIPLLYYYSYLLEALILTSYDNSGDPNRQRVDALRKVVDRKFADVLSLDEQADAATVLKASNSTMGLVLVKEGNKPILVALRDPSLWAQLLRTAVLYAYYVDWTNVPDPLVIGPSGAYWRVVTDRWTKPGSIGEGLWDRDAFNLSVTCRAIESLIDAYDYVARLEREEPMTVADASPASPSQLAEVIAAAVLPYLEGQLRARQEPQRDQPVLPEPALPEVTKTSAKSDMRKAIKDNLPSLLQPALGSIRAVSKGRLRAIGADPERSRDPVFELAFGPDGAKELEKNELAATMASVMANVAYCTVVHTMSLLLEEAAVRKLDPKEAEEYYRSSIVSGQRLNSWMERLILEFMTAEFEGRNRRERPSPGTVVDALLRLTDEGSAEGDA